MISRKPQSYWDELIHIEKLKKLKPGNFKENGKKDSIDAD